MSQARTRTEARAKGRRTPNPERVAERTASLTSKNRNAILCVLLAVGTIALYSPVIGHSFVVLDDQEYVTANPQIHQGLNWSTVRWAFTSMTAANWHPLTWLSHALDYQLFALNTAGHHLDSLLIHALNAVLSFLLLAWITKRAGPSLVVAALFALHPINVESVAWVAERKNVLSTLFFLLVIGAYAWYAQKPDWRRYLLVASLFAAGLMAKPMVITLPFVLLLLDYWPLGRIAGTPPGAAGGPQLTVSRLLLEKIPLLFLSAASAWITLKAQRSGMAVRSLHQFPLPVRLENALVAYGLYLWKMVWPMRLAPLYPHSGIALPVWQWSLSALVLIGVTALVIAFRHKGYLPVGWFWFLGTLVPVIGLVQVGDAAMADRYAYIPLIGIFVMIAWSADDWADEKEVRPLWRVVTVVCVLAGLSVITVRQLRFWENEYTLWEHTLAVTERNPFAHDAMGAALMDPHFASAASNLEGLDTEQKRMDAALQHFQQALDLRRKLAQQNPGYLPDLANTLVNVADQDRTRRRIDEARQYYDEALEIDRQLANQNSVAYTSYLAMTLNDLGILDATQNRADDARQHYEEALKLYRQLTQQNRDAYLPYLAITLNDLANLDGTQNRTEEARQNYEESSAIYRRLAQQDPEKYLSYVAWTLYNLGFLDRSQHRIAEARAHYDEALGLLRKLGESDNRYASGVAKVEASLDQLEKAAAPNN
jgi:protein O-mannosyl-transferase